MNDEIISRKLDRALTAMQRSGSSVDDVLAAHPELEAELRPLLEQADRLTDLGPEGPRRAFLVSAKKRVMNQVGRPRRSAAAAEAPERPRFGWLRRPAVALASLMLAVVLLLGMTGVVYASSDSVPGDPLYGVKRGVERARLTLTLSEQSQIDLLQQYAQERLEEIQALQESGRSEELTTAAEGYADSVDRLVERLDSSGVDPAELEEAKDSLEQHTTVLESVLAAAPEPAQPGLRNAAEKSTHGQAVIQALQEGRSPSEVAPGQNTGTAAPGSEKGRPTQAATGRPDDRGPDHTPPGLDPDRTPGPPQGAGPPDGIPGKGPYNR